MRAEEPWTPDWELAVRVAIPSQYGAIYLQVLAPLRDMSEQRTRNTDFPEYQIYYFESGNGISGKDSRETLPSLLPSRLRFAGARFHLCLWPSKPAHVVRWVLHVVAAGQYGTEMMDGLHRSFSWRGSSRSMSRAIRPVGNGRPSFVSASSALTQAQASASSFAEAPVAKMSASMTSSTGPTIALISPEDSVISTTSHFWNFMELTAARQYTRCCCAQARRFIPSS